MSDFDDDLDFSLDSSPVKAAPKSKKKQPLANSTNTSSNKSGSPKATKEPSNSDQYQRLTPLEHILKRPDTYIGSVEKFESEQWIIHEESQTMEKKKVNIVPGLFKIFDEILVNAADNKVRDPTMKKIEVKIDVENNTISVKNDGKGIPVEIHTKENMYIPELIFGNLLTSSNYDDDQKKVTGGRNGYGAKLCNIFSTEFTVKTADKINQKVYLQTWKNNMSITGKAKITNMKKQEEYTEIIFKPDLKRFGMEMLDDDIVGVLKRRVYDMCGSVRGIRVTLNGKPLKISNFKQYVELYVKALEADKVFPDVELEENSGGTPIPPGPAPEKLPTIVYQQIDARWEIAFSVSDGNFNQVSFVNSIATTTGGTHVENVSSLLINKILEQIKKKNKKAMIKPFQIKNNMFLFINCLIENPAFTSQTKEQLTTRASQFGGKKLELPDPFVKKILNSGILDSVMDIVAANADKALKRTDGSRKSRITGYSKLEDANRAGTKEGHKCTLILTEGDSALTFAVGGLAVIGRDYYGCFPLRGKVLNVREASADQIMKNGEIQAIKQIMGLQHKKKYDSNNIKSLRYGHLMIMTDQDHDGSHIKGLIINFLESSFPGLLEVPEFLIEFITPIVKVTILNGRNKGQVIAFYNMPEYEAWRDGPGKECSYKQKYYKGLGTSVGPEIREYFSQLDRHLKRFHALQEADKPLIDLAFSKKRADDRKEWLRGFVPGTFLDPALQEIPISDFINKELILFSMADNIRSLPCVLDGFKPSQRKILFGCFKRNLVNEIKVTQLAGYISENTGYHHGEQSLMMSIISLAQNFVGANNLNVLRPNGGFGSRASGGKDASAARYIFTEFMPITKKVFNPLDNPLYVYVKDDEQTVEPEWYLPVIPMLLVNGADGIGSGWSSNIPPYNPIDIVKNIRLLMNGEEMEDMIPWFKGWEGTVTRISQDRFRVEGNIEELEDNVLEITELPARMWTIQMKEFLLQGLAGTEKVKPWIKDMEEQHGVGIKFVITLTQEEMAKTRRIGLKERFKLITSISTSNMVAFDTQGRIKKYNNVTDIIEEYYHVRLDYYQRRKDYQVEYLSNQLEKLSYQARFVKMIIDNELVVSNRKRAVIIEELQKLGFPGFDKNNVAVRVINIKPEIDSDDEEELQQLAANTSAAVINAATLNPLSNYDYLLGMQIWSLTLERYQKLLKQKDERESELNELLSKSAKDLWNIDLDEFLVSWDEFLREDEENRQTLIPNANGGNKKRKRRGKAGAKTGTEAKKAKTTIASKKITEIKEEGTSTDSKKKSTASGAKKLKQSTLVSLKESTPEIKEEKKESEFKSIFGSKSSVFGKKPGSASKFSEAMSAFSNPVTLSDDSDEDEVKPASSIFKKTVTKKATPSPTSKTKAKPKAKPKAAPRKKKSVVVDSDSDDLDLDLDSDVSMGGDDNDDIAVPPKRAPRSARKTAQAQKYTLDSEDSEEAIEDKDDLSDDDDDYSDFE